MCISTPTQHATACPLHPARQAAGEQAVRAGINVGYDPNLLKPVHFVAPPEGLRPAERAAKEIELGCLRREAAATARGIDYLEKQLAA